MPLPCPQGQSGLGRTVSSRGPAGGQGRWQQRARPPLVRPLGTDQAGPGSTSNHQPCPPRPLEPVKASLRQRRFPLHNGRLPDTDPLRMRLHRLLVVGHADMAPAPRRYECAFALTVFGLGGDASSLPCPAEHPTELPTAIAPVAPCTTSCPGLPEQPAGAHPGPNPPSHRRDPG